MPTLQGTVTTAPAGLHGFDTNTVVSAATALDLRQQGFQFCIRYLSRSTPESKGDLSNGEAKAILAGGLALMPVQHVASAGWSPSKALGTKYGQAAAANAQEVGFPAGVNVWLDLEGIKSGARKDDVIAYCNAWFDEVASVGYSTGVYVGAKCVLSGDDLFWRLKTKHYWRSGSKVPDIPQRGYQLIQRITAKPDKVSGIEIDRDLTVTDSFGDSVVWLSPL